MQYAGNDGGPRAPCGGTHHGRCDGWQPAWASGFWNMVVSLGLAAMDDSRFSEDRAEFILDRFDSRDYQPNGAGGLFTLSHPTEDMRQIDIWYQLMAYLNENEF